MLTKGTFQQSCLLPHWEQRAALTPSPVTNPLYPLVSCTLGNLCKFWKKWSIRRGAASTSLVPVPWDRTGQTTGHQCPLMLELWITAGTPGQGCWDPACGVRLPNTSPCWTPQLCVSQTGWALRELLKNQTCEQTITQSQHPKGAAGLQGSWRGQKAGKGKGREPEGFHVSSQEHSRTALELRPGTRALHTLQGEALRWDTNIFI